MRHIKFLRPSVAKQPNLELKTRPRQLLGSLPLVIALPAQRYQLPQHKNSEKMNEMAMLSNSLSLKFAVAFIHFKK